jgi:hypothetical protein
MEKPKEQKLFYFPLKENHKTDIIPKSNFYNKAKFNNNLNEEYNKRV